MGLQIQGSNGNLSKVDANTGALYVNPRPIDVGALGSYSLTVKTGIMAAGLSANSPICAFLWKPTTPATALAVMRRIKLSLYNLGTGFAAGDALFELFVARAFTVQDTGGGAATLTTNNAKLRTSYATTQAAVQVSTTATLTAGTRTLDANPLTALQGVVTTAAFGQAFQQELFTARPGEQPLILAGSGEGVVIQATVPATGTWTAYATFDWDEVLSTEI